jgi:RNA polymerase sigma factor for flagellar operon FliA
MWAPGASSVSGLAVAIPSVARMSTEKSVQPENVRVFRRAPLTVPVEVVAEDGRRVSAPADNLSEGGIFVLTREVLPMMSLARVRFCLPTEPDRPWTADAVVRWLRPAGRFAPGIGLEFVSLPDEMTLAIHRYVDAHEPMVWEDGPSVGMALPREVALEYIPIIRRIAHGQARAGDQRVDDLIGAGFLGLLEAYRTFRASEGAPFEAYARMRIRGAMKDESRAKDPLTRGQRQLVKQLREARRSLARAHGREPAAHDIAKVLGVSPERIAEIDALSRATEGVVSIDEHPDATGGDGSPEEPLLQRERREALDQALAALPERLREVLRMYYGDAMTLRSIATVLGVSEARVSQLHADAVRKLRKAYEA